MGKAFQEEGKAHYEIAQHARETSGESRKYTEKEEGRRLSCGVRAYLSVP